MKKALLLIAHGSRNKEANEDLVLLAKRLVSDDIQIVEPSYLELAEPGIESGGDTCVLRGAQQVIMVPYFLSAGVHVRKDLTESCDLLSKKHPTVQFKLAGHLGRHPLLETIIRERIKEARG